MQKAEILLSILKEKSFNEKYIFDRVYRNFFNPDFYIYSYQDIQKNDLISGEYSHFNIDDELLIIEIMKSESYLKYFNEKNKFQVLIEDITIKLLEAIFNKEIINHYYSYANFEINIIEIDDIRDQALNNVKKYFYKCDWLIKENIKIINWEKLILLIENNTNKKISDNRFLALLTYQLKQKIKSKNIVFWNDRLFAICFKICFKNLLHEAAMLDENEIIKMKNKINIEIIRYQDNLLFGSKDKIKLNTFVKKLYEIVELNKIIDVSRETSIKNFNKDGMNYLNFNIKKISLMNTKKNNNCRIKIVIPINEVNIRIRPYIKGIKANHFGNRVNLSVKLIVKKFIKDYLEFYKEYCIADNFNKRLRKFKYYNYKSLLKTIGRKEKLSIKKVIIKYGSYIRLEYKKSKQKN